MAHPFGVSSRKGGVSLAVANDRSLFSGTSGGVSFAVANDRSLFSGTVTSSSEGRSRSARLTTLMDRPVRAALGWIRDHGTDANGRAIWYRQRGSTVDSLIADG